MKRRKSHVGGLPRRKLQSLPVSLCVEYRGMPDDRDHQIEKLVGRDRDGSGYGFVDNVRDLGFGFATVRGAQGAGKRVKAALGRRVKVSVL